MAGIALGVLHGIAVLADLQLEAALRGGGRQASATRRAQGGRFICGVRNTDSCALGFINGIVIACFKITARCTGNGHR